MFQFISHQLIQNRIRVSTRIYHVCFVQTQSLKKSNTNNSKTENQESLTVSYLINSCGLSLESAISVSKKIKIKSTVTPDSVLELFRTHGFTETQIKNMITKGPSLLLSKPDKTLNPKIEFFKSLGISTPELAVIISKEPLLLQRGLDNHIVPALNFIKTLVHTDQNLVKVLKKFLFRRFTQYDIEKAMGPNISILRTHGVPEPSISQLILLDPSALMLRTDRFEVGVRVLKKWGFDPKSMGFILAVRTMMMLSESKLEQKMELYRSFGLSEEEIISAFKLQPMFMLPSEEKIKKIMNFIVNKLGSKPSLASKYPGLLMLSLEKRIIPRCSILQILMSKGLVKKDIIVPSVLRMTEKFFLEKFVIKYSDKVPEIVMAHQGKIEFQGFHDESKYVC